jgi:hypothetical protein
VGDGPEDGLQKTITVTMLALAGFSVWACPALAADEPRALEPAGDWIVDGGDESCALRRAFGSDEERATFRLQTFQPGSGRYLAQLWGKPLPDRRDGAIEFERSFEPDSKALATGGILSTTQGGHMVTFPTSLARTAEIEAATGDSPSPFGPDEAREAEVNAFVIKFSRGKPLRLHLGSMAEPIARLRRCAEELPAKWGLDPASQARLSRHPVPIDMGKWLGAGTYPFNLLMSYRSAIVQVRLMVDAQGAPTDCKIQSPPGNPGAGVIACREILKAARFEPALDAQGAPVPSYYSVAIIYQTKRKDSMW